MVKNTNGETGGNSGEEDATAQAMELMAKTLQVEYRFLVYYHRLMDLVPNDQNRANVRMLGEDSLRHADLVSQTIRAMGGTPAFPPLEPFPGLPVREIFQRQLEYEKLALMLHTRAAELVAPEWREPLLGIAKQERWHVLVVEKILEELG